MSRFWPWNVPAGAVECPDFGRGMSQQGPWNVPIFGWQPHAFINGRRMSQTSPLNELYSSRLARKWAPAWIKKAAPVSKGDTPRPWFHGNQSAFCFWRSV
jgi:hypothetical protein